MKKSLNRLNFFLRFILKNIISSPLKSILMLIGFLGVFVSLILAFSMRDFFTSYYYGKLEKTYEDYDLIMSISPLGQTRFFSVSSFSSDESIQDAIDKKAMFFEFDVLLQKNEDVKTYVHVKASNLEMLKNINEHVSYPSELLDDEMIITESLALSMDIKMNDQVYIDISGEQKTKRIAQNIHFNYNSPYGNIELTINLSKPEKDPKDIAKALEESIDDKKGPKCVLCKENEQNYQNARMNLRIVPLELASRKWHFQYSPYLYFNEHSIILSDTHKPMHINKTTFKALFDFIDFMPSYFVGSNADLPIVGGSILNHDHYQSGRYHFPIEHAKVIKTYHDIERVTISHLYWPLSTIRLASNDRYQLEELAAHILSSWKTYEHKHLEIIPFTTKPHQTITPIARYKNNTYELDLILRNNRTTKAYPDGIFHPHQEHHHIKKENIGLIEAAGLAILPGRLKEELAHAYLYLKEDKIHPSLQKHILWLNQLKDQKIISHKEDLYQEVGKIFTHVLEDAGVFKLDDSGLLACDKFIQDLIKTYKKM